ncbi:MAG: alpha/beta hydrolase domain-containing protein [Acidobacteriota bacterium]|nr:alpha/beta hydrolase domain-containing protein [Acidobacteriota bacterium]
MRTHTLRFALAVLAIALMASSAAAGNSPTLSGPITGGVHGAPFSAPTQDVGPLGYVTEEFFLEGSASAYRLAEGSELTSDGKWTTEKETATVPYKSRILVVRPKDDADFNGTVIVHWQNVTAGRELGSVSAAQGEYLRGYAWVGVSAQKIGIHGFPGPDAAGLKQWDPERYGSLEHPGDAYSYDIFTQAARVIGPERNAGGTDPMGGLGVERLVAAGASQSASRLRTYINGVHHLEKVFAGYLPYIDFASPVPFASDRPESGGRRSRVSARVREDLDVPVFVVNSETETLPYFPARQPDTSRYRFWEVAGTSHVSVAREAAGSTPGMDHPNWHDYTPSYNAAIRHMHVWLTRGSEPPTMPLIEVADNAVQRDDRGNALGGIRLPGIAVPTAEHNGRGRPVQGGSRFAFLYGYAQDFSADELRKLYKNRDAFLAKYDQALAKSVEAGVVVSEEAPQLREGAAKWATESLPAS